MNNQNNQRRKTSHQVKITSELLESQNSSDSNDVPKIEITKLSPRG